MGIMKPFDHCSKNYSPILFSATSTNAAMPKRHMQRPMGEVWIRQPAGDEWKHLQAGFWLMEALYSAHVITEVSQHHSYSGAASAQVLGGRDRRKLQKARNATGAGVDQEGLSEGDATLSAVPSAKVSHCRAPFCKVTSQQKQHCWKGDPCIIGLSYILKRLARVIIGLSYILKTWSRFACSLFCHLQPMSSYVRTKCLFLAVTCFITSCSMMTLPTLSRHHEYYSSPLYEMGLTPLD